jgi:hypothetical protein
MLPALKPVAGDVGQTFLQVVIQQVGKLFEGKASAAGPAAQKGLTSGPMERQPAAAFGAGAAGQAP